MVLIGRKQAVEVMNSEFRSRIATQRNHRFRFPFACRFGLGCWGVHSAGEMDQFKRDAERRELELCVECVYCLEGCCRSVQCRGQTAMHPAGAVVAEEDKQRARRVQPRRRRCRHRRKRTRASRRKRRHCQVSAVRRQSGAGTTRNADLTAAVQLVEDVHSKALNRLVEVGEDILRNAGVARQAGVTEEVLGAAAAERSHTTEWAECHTCWELEHPVESEWERVFGAPPAPEEVAMELARGYSDTFSDFERRQNSIRSNILQSEQGKSLWDNLRNHGDLLFPQDMVDGKYEGLWRTQIDWFDRARSLAADTHSRFNARMQKIMADADQQ